MADIQSRPDTTSREFLATFGRIGILSFGGPAGQIAVMHRILVEEKKWLDEARFLHALNFCMLLPGPEATQLATYAGWLLRGVGGGLIAGLLFVLPGAMVMIGLSAVYLLYGDVGFVEGLLFGVKAAVLAIVIDALLRIGRRALKDRQALLIAVAAFVGIALFNLPFPLIVLGAAAVGALLARPVASDDAAPVNAGNGGRSLRRTAGVTATWLAIWFGPLVLLYAALGWENVFTRQAAFFSTMAVVSFGGAYAVLAYVAQQAVEVYGWLRPEEMLTGLGLAETTPGPLILVLVFVGFLGGARVSGLEPMLGGLAGAVVALWFTFVPCFLWIFAGAPFVERMRDIGWLSGAFAAVTAAVVGVIANLALWFALHVLFAEVGDLRLGPLHLPVPAWESFDGAAAAIALAAAIGLLGVKANMFLVLGLAAVAGVAWAML